MLSSLGLLASPARADQVPGSALPAGMVDPNVAKPAFAMMDNTGDGSQVQVDMSATFLSNPDGTASAQLLRPHVLAQYVDPTGVGGYASFGGAGAAGDGVDSTFKLGNLELGGLYQRVVTPEINMAFRAGVTFHTAADDDDVNTLALAIARPSDVVDAAPASYLRLAVAPTVHSGMVFGRVDFGVDVRLNHDGGHPIGHFNAGVGIGQAMWSATAEFGVAFPLSDMGDPIKIAGLAARYNAGPVSPFLAVSYPFDVGELGNAFNVLAGLAIPLAI